MIKYNFGIECEISWTKFLCFESEKGKLYKKNFKNFSEFFYFLDNNKKDITKLLFDGYEYILENGLLHNLYGPAKIRYTEEDDHAYLYPGTKKWFFINGKLVTDKQENVRGCKNEKDFENNEIFFYEEITGKKTHRDTITGKMYIRKEDVDYRKHLINLGKLKEKDIRKKKLKQINNINDKRNKN